MCELNSSELQSLDSSCADLSQFQTVVNPVQTSQNLSFEYDFIEVIVKRGIGRSAFNDMLSVFQKHNVGNFPKDGRACVGALRKVHTVPMFDGRFYHFGLVPAVVLALKHVKLNSNRISVQVCTDGLPISKSSSTCFWPILCRVISDDFVSKVFIVSLYSGSSKPFNAQIFFKPFLDDVKIAYAEGIKIGDRTFDFSVHSVVCDAVARQFVKCIISHSGYYSCERCVVRGEWYNGVRFTEMNCEARTDFSFRNRSHPLHHSDLEEAGVSPFIDIPLDMVRDFPLDYMHLVLLGVVKRLLKIWLCIKKIPQSHVRQSTLYRLQNGIDNETINRRQAKFSRSVPCDFQRRPRSFEYVNIFKATEFRIFLCYSSPIILKNVFGSSIVYQHFMLLVVAMRILLTPNQPGDVIEFARRCLRSFVDKFASIYSAHNLSYNVHSIIHIADDYDRFGALDKISSFSFESFMFIMKRLIKRSGKELEQVVKRLHEASNFNITPTPVLDCASFKGRHCNGPLSHFDEEDVIQYSEVEFRGRKFRLDSSDDFMYSKKTYGRIVNILKVGLHVVVLVLPFLEITDVFVNPCHSSDVGIVLVQTLGTRLLNFHLTEVRKCWCVKWADDKCYAVQLLHES